MNDYSKILQIFEYLYNEYSSIKPEFVSERYGYMLAIIDLIRDMVECNEEVKK